MDGDSKAERFVQENNIFGLLMYGPKMARLRVQQQGEIHATRGRLGRGWGALHVSCPARWTRAV
jgi:hypothetical protein